MTKILVADDEPELLELVRFSLDAAGFEEMPHAVEGTSVQVRFENLTVWSSWLTTAGLELHLRARSIPHRAARENVSKMPKPPNTVVTLVDGAGDANMMGRIHRGEPFDDRAWLVKYAEIVFGDPPAWFHLLIVVVVPLCVYLLLRLLIATIYCVRDGFRADQGT